MSANSKVRGHEVEYSVEQEVWVYSDTKQPVPVNYLSRSCGHCGKDFTVEGHDGCLGTLPGLMNACCGHGDPKDAYVQFLDGTSVHGEDAVIIQNILKKYKNK